MLDRHSSSITKALNESRMFARTMLFALACCPGVTVLAQSGVNSSAHSIDITTAYRAQNFSFLRDAVGNRSVVQLGESIHLTDEFPRVRERLVRYLHENMRFDVIALEGSQINAWLAMERLYSAPGDTAVVGAAQEIAWFPLWDTSAMRELMRYVAATQRTASPLYLSSFDMQAGSSRPTGDSVFSQLFHALSRFAPAPSGTPRWATALIAARGCQASYYRPAADEAIDGVKRWVAAASVQAARARPAAHIAAMRMLPENLRQLTVLCDAQRANIAFVGARQVARDSLAASNVIALRDTLSASHRIITWGHHAHLFYNTIGGSLTSMGERLRSADPSSVYTIGLFAGGGTSYDIADADLIPISRRRIRSVDSYSSDRVLRTVGAATGYRDYFLDLSRLDPHDDSAFFIPGITRFESRGKRRSILARDFDGAIYVDQVTPPRLLFAGSALLGIADAKGLWLDHTLLIVIALIIVAGLATRRCSGTKKSPTASRYSPRNN